jgi:predicted RNA polymerase sigma factor
MLDTRKLISDLGGAATLAETIGSSRTAVSNWPRDGVPSKFWHVLVEIAAEKEIEGVTFEALRAARPPRQEAA